MAMLVFSTIALVAWLASPGFRGQMELRRGVLVGAVSAAIAFGIASAPILIRGH